MSGPTVWLQTAWAHEGVDGTLPWLVSAYDEFTFDEWGGVPDFHTEAVANANYEVREVRIVVPLDAVRSVFAVPVVPAEVAS